MDKKQIFDTFQLQPLSEEEKAKKHILCRLFGPIATTVDKTRNGRLYNDELWNKQIEDEILKEKIENKSLFLEFSHPTDREETDPLKACACIPEMPKIVDGDVYGVVDVLDTPSGQILKTFIDYGFRPGISSRGTGDVGMDNTVDPETFFLETWDIVLLPAVKKARLDLVESLDTDNVKLKKALKEVYNTADKENKKIMKAILEDLKNDIANGSEILTEITEDDEAQINEAVEDEILVEIGSDAVLKESKDEEADEAETSEEEVEQEADTEAEPEAEPKETTEDISEDEADEEETEDSEDESKEEDAEPVTMVKDVKNLFKDFDDDLPVEISSVEIDGHNYEVELSIDSDKEKINIGVNCIPAEENNENIDEVESSDSEPADNPAEEAIDDGSDEVMENVKELIRQKTVLEQDNKTLKNEKSVSDAKVKELEESLVRHRDAFERTSEIAAKSTKFEKENKNLKEQLAQRTSEIISLREQLETKRKLDESISRDANQIKVLKENLDSASKEHTKLTEELANCKKMVADRTAIAKDYKKKFTTMLNAYLQEKAELLGVRTSEITNRLNESYTLADINRVCDEIISSNVGTNNLPFGRTTINAKRFNISEGFENRPVKKYVTPDDGYEIDPMLIELANTKK